MNQTIKQLAVVLATAVMLTWAPAAFALPPGDYLEDKFLADLQMNRSPNDAIRKEMDKGIAQLIHVSRGRQGLDFMAIWNWQEGATLFTLHADGTIEEGEGWKTGGFDPQASPIEDGTGHFRLRFKNQSLGYTFVGNADKTITDIAVVGRYKDSQGNSVLFGSDGWLHGPGFEGPFKLDNDHVFDQYDFFLLGREKPRVIAFRWEDGRMTLYPTHPFPDQRPFRGEPEYDHPLTILYPVSGGLGTRRHAAPTLKQIGGNNRHDKKNRLSTQGQGYPTLRTDGGREHAAYRRSRSVHAFSATSSP